MCWYEINEMVAGITDADITITDVDITINRICPGFRFGLN